MAVIRVLNVAEKPSVAKSVATILSNNRMQSRAGRSRYNRIYEFGYAIRGQQCAMLFTSVTGHLMELAFEDQFRKWSSCDPLALYEAPVHKRVPPVGSPAAPVSSSAGVRHTQKVLLYVRLHACAGTCAYMLELQRGGSHVHIQRDYSFQVVMTWQ